MSPERPAMSSMPARASALAGVRIGLLERPHLPGHQGALVDRLTPALLSQGADVQVVHAERGRHRLDVAPPWDVVVLKSGSAAALHVAAAAQAWGIPSVNSAAATRTAQDKLLVALMCQDAGLPVARSWATTGIRPSAANTSPSGMVTVRPRR